MNLQGWRNGRRASKKLTQPVQGCIQQQKHFTFGGHHDPVEVTRKKTELD